MTTTDLWPDIKFDPKPRGVRQILEEAGAALKQKTNGLVEFRVWPADGQLADFPFRFRCVMHVEKLDYDYPLLEVDSSASGFPVKVRSGGVAERADDESKLLTALAKVFQSDQTLGVIKNLISIASE